MARADFDQTLEYRVAGSCRVQAIRAQIEHTLRQFPTVTEVVISINGKTEEILEP
ncbi:MAG: GerMN domain-containing protein [Desulfobacteraceae bacterium]